MAYPINPPDPTAVVGRRIAAFFIDLAVVTIAVLAIVGPAVAGALVTAPSGAVDCDATNSSTSFDNLDDPSNENPNFCYSTGDGNVRYLPVEDEGGIYSLFYAAALGAGLLNSVLLQGLVGASLGKLALGLRVIRKDGRRANVGWNLLRWVLLLAGTLFCCIGWIIDLVMVFTTKGHRRVGDFAAGTFVVGKADAGTPPQIVGLTAPEMVPTGYPQPGMYGTQPGAYPQPGGYGTQPTWTPPPTAVPPGAPPADPQTPPPVQPTPSAPEGPIWDEARDTYIQYDPELGEWVQWDVQGNRWRSIDQ